MRLALLMLFANQAFPTAGLSGGTAVVRALRRRGVPLNVAAGALLVGVVTTYIADQIAIVVAVAFLRAFHSFRWWLLARVTIGAAIAVGVPTALADRARARRPRADGAR